MKNAAFWTMIGGGVLALGAPCAGVLGTVLGMARGFATLDKTGVADPESLADAIGQTLMATATGLFVGGFGLVIFFAGLVVWLNLRPSSPPPPIPAEGSHP